MSNDHNQQQQHHPQLQHHATMHDTQASRTAAWTNARSKSQASLVSPNKNSSKNHQSPLISQHSSLLLQPLLLPQLPPQPQSPQQQQQVPEVNLPPEDNHDNENEHPIVGIRSPRRHHALQQAHKDITHLETMLSPHVLAKLNTLLRKTSSQVISSGSSLEEIFLKTEDHTTEVVEGYNEILERFRKCVDLLNDLKQACEQVVNCRPTIPDPLILPQPYRSGAPRNYDDDEEGSMMPRDADSDDEMTIVGKTQAQPTHGKRGASPARDKQVVKTSGNNSLASSTSTPKPRKVSFGKDSTLGSPLGTTTTTTITAAPTAPVTPAPITPAPATPAPATPASPAPVTPATSAPATAALPSVSRPSTPTPQISLNSSSNEISGAVISGSSAPSSNNIINIPLPTSGPIAVRVSIPIVGLRFQTSFEAEKSTHEAKLILLEKIKTRAGVRNVSPSSYHLKVAGLRVLDEREPLWRVLVTDKSTLGGAAPELELIRTLEYEINIAQNSLSEPLIIGEVMTVNTVATRVLAKACFPGNDLKKYNFALIGGRFGSTEKMDPQAMFVSFGLRGTDGLKIVAEPKEPSDPVLEETLDIQHSPWDPVDDQKRHLQKRGFLKKQGGARGGNKSWLKRWFEMDQNQLAYYSDNTAKAELKGIVNLMQFVGVEDVTDQKRKDKTDTNHYFAIYTSDRQLFMRTKHKQDMDTWITSIRKYTDLIRLEQTYGVKIYTPQDHPMIQAQLARTQTFIRFRKPDEIPEENQISAPFLTKKLMSVNADWQWNSDENPLEVFEFLEELGVGACGRVLKAAHKRMNNFIVAIKIVKQGDKRIQNELEKEMEILKKCRSENVIAYYGTILRENETWILMDYCGVGSVKDIMKVTDEPLSQAQCQYVVLHTLKGLTYMHSVNILHLDIKAANILLTEQGVIKLADFGVSQVLKTDEMTHTDYIGSPLFMAPEIIKKEGFNNKADIWSLGITIIEMMEMRPPNTDIADIKKLPELAERPPPKLKNPGLYSPEFIDFVSVCLVKDPVKRPSTVDLRMHSAMTVNVPNVDVIKNVIYECLALASKHRKKFKKTT